MKARIEIERRNRTAMTFFLVSVQCQLSVIRRNDMEFKRFHLILLGYF